MPQTAPLIALSEITKQRRWLINLLGVFLQTLCSKGGDDPSVGLPLLLCQQLQNWSTCSIFLSPGGRERAKQAGLAHGQILFLIPSHPTPPHSTKPPLKGRQVEAKCSKKFAWPQNLGWSSSLGRETIVEWCQEGLSLSQHSLILGSLRIPEDSQRIEKRGYSSTGYHFFQGGQLWGREPTRKPIWGLET